jgi:hypothetical protein
MSQILPTKKEFQTIANDIKTESNITRCQAYEKLAKKYGYKTYHDIKPLLKENTETPGVTIVSFEEFSQMEKDRIFSQASKSTTYYKQSNKFTNQSFVEDIAFNPKLPSNFWSNPNEDRDYEELQDWWDKAFIISNNGAFVVYRLDGAAWDRPSRKDTFDKFEDALKLAQSLNNVELTYKNKYITLSTGAVVHVSGLFIDSKGNKICDDSDSNKFNMQQIEKAKLFIECIMEKRETINKSEGSSYTLKHRVEDFLNLYFKRENNYISNGEMIVALDSCGYKIKETPSNPNIYTNHKTLKDFNSRLARNDYAIHKDKFQQIN